MNTHKTVPVVEDNENETAQKEREPSTGLQAKAPAKPSVSGQGQSGLTHGARTVESARGQPIRILVADDHPVVRKGLSNCLAHNKHLVVVGEAKDGAEALGKARELSPDLVLMDIAMPKLNGLSATEILHRENPHTKIVILSMHNPAHYPVQMLKCGARGCVSKDASTAELVQAIETVAGGGDYFSAEVAQAVIRELVEHGHSQRHQKISPREHEVLVAIAEGLSNKEIASRLEVGVRTVETHRERIMHKLNLRGAADITRFAIAEGLISLPNVPEPTVTDFAGTC